MILSWYTLVITVVFILTSNTFLVLREFLENCAFNNSPLKRPLFSLTQVIPISNVISITMHRLLNTHFQESLKAYFMLNLYLSLFHHRNGQRINPHSDPYQSLQLRCPIEPRSWDLQSTRLGFHHIDFTHGLQSHSPR